MISYLLALFGLKDNNENHINDMDYRIAEQEVKRLTKPRSVYGKYIYNHITKEEMNTFDLKDRPFETIQLRKFIMEQKKECGSFEITTINSFGDIFNGFVSHNITDYVEYCHKNNINLFDSYLEVKNDSRQQSI